MLRDYVKPLRRFFHCRFCDIVKCLVVCRCLAIYFKPGTTGGSHCVFVLGSKVAKEQQNNNKKENITWKSLLDPSPVRQSPDFYGVIKADRTYTDQAILRATDNRELSSLIFTNVSVESEFNTLQ